MVIVNPNQFLDYQDYAIRLARRLVRYRRSSMIDEHDLTSGAMMALWQKQEAGTELDERIARQTIKYTMLETLRNSALVRTRAASMQHAIRTYQEISVSNEPRHSPVEAWIDAEPVREVVDIMEEFPYEDQVLLSLVWEEGCSLAEVAEILSISKSRVFQRYGDLIKSIKAKLLNRRRKTVKAYHS